MSNKSNTLKNYLKDIGTNNQLFFMFGNTPVSSENNTSDQAIDVWKNSALSYRVARKDSVAVVPNVTWSSGNIYTSWSSLEANTGSYYAWNKANGIVYLCISNNDINRKDLEGTINSTEVPSHSFGLKKYPDGYTWLALYKITADLLRFVSTTWMPVISFDDYRVNDTSRYSKAQSFCTNNQSQEGYCGVYAKKAMQIPNGSSTFDTYNAGSLINSFETTCKNCYFMFENDDRFVSVFTNSTSASTITVKDTFDEVADLIARNAISPSSPYYALYQISNNGLADGAIVSAIIDLDGFTESNLVVDEMNPAVTINSSSGSGGSIRLVTYKNADGENIVEGVEVLSNGQDYRDISLSITYSKFPYLTTEQVDALLAGIEINLDTIDGLNFDPVSALGSENILFDVRIETNYLRQNDITIPEEINFYGLVENPIEEINSEISIIAGSQYGKDLSYVESNLITVNAIGPSVPPTNNGNTSATTVGGKQIGAISIDGARQIGPVADEVEVDLKISGIDYKVAEDLNTLTVNSAVYAVQSVETPVFRQYTGKVAQSKKLGTSLQLGSSTTTGENTRIFRINIVKGF